MWPGGRWGASREGAVGWGVGFGFRVVVFCFLCLWGCLAFRMVFCIVFNISLASFTSTADTHCLSRAQG